MSVVLLAHLSDAHLRTVNDPLMRRASALAQAIAGEIDGSVKGCVIAFTGDATDKGFAPGFGVAKQFLENLVNEIERLAKIRPVVLSIPGNHDLVLPEDPSLRDVAVDSLTGMPRPPGPKGAGRGDPSPLERLLRLRRCRCTGGDAEQGSSVLRCRR